MFLINSSERKSVQSISSLSEDKLIVAEMNVKFRLCKSKFIQHLESMPAEIPYVSLIEVQNFMNWMQKEGKFKYAKCTEWQNLDNSFAPLQACVEQANFLHAKAQKYMALVLMKETLPHFVKQFNHDLNNFHTYLIKLSDASQK